MVQNLRGFQLELHDSPHSDNKSILQRHARHSPNWKGASAAGSMNVLKVGLQRDSTPYFVLIDRGEKAFRRPDRPKWGRTRI